MFIYTLKASNIKFFAMLTLSIAALVTLVTVIPEYGAAREVATVTNDYSGIKTEEDRIEFLRGFGYEVDPNPVEDDEITVPEEFDSVYTKYNDLQRAQGLNLKKYRGKTVSRYIYTVTNYEGYDGTVLATVLVYKNRIIAGDICGIDGEGFVHGFEKSGI